MCSYIKKKGNSFISLKGHPIRNRLHSFAPELQDLLQYIYECCVITWTTLEVYTTLALMIRDPQSWDHTRWTKH